jgi:hypothetical protein
MGNLLRNSDGRLLRNSAGHLLRSSGETFWGNRLEGAGFASHSEAELWLFDNFNYAVSIPPNATHEEYVSGWSTFTDYKEDIIVGYWLGNAIQTSAFVSSVCRVMPVSSKKGESLNGVKLSVAFDIKSGGGSPMIGVATGSASTPQTSQYSDLLGSQSMDISSWTTTEDWYYGTFNFLSPIVLDDYLYVYYFFENHRIPTSPSGDNSYLFLNTEEKIELIMGP